jgi:hypothetical protein
MATLTPTLTLASNDISTAETLNLTLSNALTIDGPVITYRLLINHSSTNIAADNAIAAAADFTKAHVLLYNTSATPGDTINIGMSSIAFGGDLTAASTFLSLGPGEFAWFPWDSENTLIADATQNIPELEVRIYQVAS